MGHFYYEKDAPLKKNKWGIDESTDGKKTLIKDIDLVIVPLITFDKKGHRIGYGKGYYDTFLAQCKHSCLKIGVSFFDPVEYIDADPHDVLLDGCISPQKIYSFNTKNSLL